MTLVDRAFDTTMTGLAWDFHVSPSSCNNPAYYDEYIRFSALTDKKTGVSVTRVIVDTDKNKIAGYVSLRASSLVGESASAKKTVQPAVEIAELAVDGEYESSGVGTNLLNIAIATAALLRETIGIRHIIVCSDPCAVGFYKKHGFADVASLYEYLHDGWNDDCHPMYITLPED